MEAMPPTRLTPSTIPSPIYLSTITARKLRVGRTRVGRHDLECMARFEHSPSGEGSEGKAHASVLKCTIQVILLD